jgi:hypothetical protein
MTFTFILIINLFCMISGRWKWQTEKDSKKYEAKCWGYYVTETSKYLTSHFGKALDGETWKEITIFVSDRSIKRI